MPGRIARFGAFEADLDAEELRRAGRLVRIQHQPFEVLRALVDRPGELVTREALRGWLWPDGVTVDFDQSLNKSVTKLRDALGDSAENPRFVETLPKRGYRFIAPVTVGPATAAAAPAAEVRPPSGGVPRTAPPQPPARRGATASDTPAEAPWPRRHARVAAAAALVAITLVAGALIVRDGSGAAPAPPAAPRASEPARAGLSPIFAAEDAYRRGRLALARQTPASLALAVEHFELAAGLSPAYADAWAGLADALTLQAAGAAAVPGAALARARDAANRALSLAPALAGAHAALGQASLYLDGDWPTARWHFEKALSLDHGDSSIRRAYALALAARGEREAAERQARAGLTAAPLEPAASDALGYVLYLAGRHAEADQHLTRALTIDPDFVPARRHLARLRVEQGRAAEAVPVLERVAVLSGDAPRALAELAWATGLAGDRQRARAIAGRLARSGANETPPASRALASWGAGDAGTAVSWLLRALDARAVEAAFVGVDPVWRELRARPAVRAVLGAPPARTGPVTG